MRENHLLLQGTWKALDRYLADPKVLVVDSPEVVQKQAVALGPGARRAIAILLLLILLLAFNIVPAPIAAVICATLMVVTRVLTLNQFYRGIDWNTCLLIGAMIPPATAMANTGAAALIGDYIVNALGGFGPVAVLAGLFVASAIVTQFISNTSSALVMMPIGLATASELGVSALPMMLGVAMGASASFLTPFANGVSLMVYGPGGYKFGDFWKLGLIVMAWALIVTVVVIPLYWTLWRLPKGRRKDRVPLGRQPQGAAGGLQARLDQARQGRALQAQRSDAERAADRGRDLPRHRHSGQSRRQGPQDGHPGLSVRLWRRISATRAAILNVMADSLDCYQRYQPYWRRHHARSDDPESLRGDAPRP
ncbi:MAG: hypothetical protein K0S00_2534 [Xanthobacteraceae bacterium]|jgi:hypothetical protein|nr:hypothetical protein [Xanthobacteraceae bacterium]MDF2809735.1 hypothetical protein [Microvirga sp.]